MKLAFYYHIPVRIRNDELFLPGFLGIFVDALADNLEKLFLIAHTIENAEEDYRLSSKNIELVNLGPKTTSLHRSFFSKKVLKPVHYILDSINAFLVRSPSPLAPAFAKYRNKGIPVFYYVVGNYSYGADFMQIKSLRDLAIRYFLKWNHAQFMRMIKGHKVLVNSPALHSEISKIANHVELVPSSTLTEDDLFYDKKPKAQEVRKVLYTGRLDFSKGLMELTSAVGQLISDGFQLELHLVGWEHDSETPVENAIRNYALEQNISNWVVFHGKKKVGRELNEMYRMADIYCIPSYHEGFPRTIWEAMANRLPVIATRVGGIPFYLEDGVDAILIEPKNENEIVHGLKRLINSTDLEVDLIENGFEKAKNNTVDKRAAELIKFLNENL